MSRKNEVLTLAEAARQYHMSYGGLRGAIERKRLNAVLIDKHWYVERDAIEAYLKSKYDQEEFKQNGQKIFSMEAGQVMPCHASIMVGLSRELIYAYLRSGKLKGIKKGKFWVIEVAELKRVFGSRCNISPNQYEFSFECSK